MLRDRYDPVDLFALVPAVTLAFEPVLARLDTLLDDDTLFQAVKADLARRHPHTLETGWPSTPGEVLLRMLIVRRLYGWRYAETEHFVGDNLVLHQFCRLGLNRVPNDTTLLHWANLIRPATPEMLLDHVVALARQSMSPGTGSCGAAAPSCRRRSTTRPSPACRPTRCGCSAG